MSEERAEEFAPVPCPWCRSVPVKISPPGYACADISCNARPSVYGNGDYGLALERWNACAPSPSKPGVPEGGAHARRPPASERDELSCEACGSGREHWALGADPETYIDGLLDTPAPSDSHPPAGAGPGVLPFLADELVGALRYEHRRDDGCALLHHPACPTCALLARYDASAPLPVEQRTWQQERGAVVAYLEANRGVARHREEWRVLVDVIRNGDHTPPGSGWERRGVDGALSGHVLGLEQHLAQLQLFAVAFRGTIKVRMMAQISQDVVMWHAVFDPGARRRKVNSFGDTPLEAVRRLSEKLVGWKPSPPPSQHRKG
jgi:hypothetical protein